MNETRTGPYCGVFDVNILLHPCYTVRLLVPSRVFAASEGLYVLFSYPYLILFQNKIQRTSQSLLGTLGFAGAPIGVWLDFLSSQNSWNSVSVQSIL